MDIYKCKEIKMKHPINQSTQNTSVFSIYNKNWDQKEHGITKQTSD